MHLNFLQLLKMENTLFRALDRPFEVLIFGSKLYIDLYPRFQPPVFSLNTVSGLGTFTNG